MRVDSGSSCRPSPPVPPNMVLRLNHCCPCQLTFTRGYSSAFTSSRTRRSCWQELPCSSTVATMVVDRGRPNLWREIKPKKTKEVKPFSSIASRRSQMCIRIASTVGRECISEDQCGQARFTIRSSCNEYWTDFHRWTEQRMARWTACKAC